MLRQTGIYTAIVSSSTDVALLIIPQAITVCRGVMHALRLLFYTLEQ